MTILAVSGCSNNTNWVYRFSNAEITAGMYIGYSIEACQEAYSNDEIDTSVALLEQTIDGTPVLDWVKAQTENSCKRHLVAEQLFDDYQLSFTDEEMETIDYLTEYYWSFYQSSYEAEGCGYESFYKIILNTYKENKVFEYMYSEDGPTPVNSAEMRKAFDDEYTNMKYFSISLTDEEGNVLEGDDLSAKVSEVEEMVKRIQDGESFEKIRAEANETEYDEADEDADTAILTRLDSTSYATALMDKLNDLKEGETDYAQSEKYIYVVQRLATDDEDYDQAYIDLLGNEKGDEFKSYISQLTSSSTVESNSAALRKYNPKKLLKQ